MNELEYHMMMRQAQEGAMAELNTALIGMVEEIDGRVPTGEELDKFGASLSLMDDTRGAMRRFVIWRAAHVLEWSREYVVELGSTCINGRVKVLVSAQRLSADEWPQGLRLAVAQLQREASGEDTSRPVVIGMAIYKPTGQPVQLVEHIDQGAGWVVRDQEGKQFGARPEELEGMSPMGGAS